MNFRGKQTGAYKEVRETFFKRVGKKSGEVVAQNPEMDSKPAYTPESLCQLKTQISTSHCGIFNN